MPVSVMNSLNEQTIDQRVLLKLKNEVLLRLRDTLCKKLEPHKYYSLLRQMRVFEESDEQEVRAQITSIDRSSILLDKVLRRDDAYDVLQNVLKRIPTESFILTIMNDTLVELIEEDTAKYHGQITALPGVTDDDDVQDLPGP